jgi:basic membrane protein A
MGLRRLIAVIVAVSMVSLLVSGCGAPANEGTNGEDPATTTGKVYKVAMVLASSVNDGGWGSNCYQGMKAAAEKYGWEIAYSENVKDADYATAFTEYANMGFDMIFAPGNQYQDAVLEVASSFPDTSFAILNGYVHTENVSSMQYDNTVHGFIAGMLAGLKTQTNYCGILAAMQITSSLQQIDGFKQGVAYVNPQAEVIVSYTDSFNDPAKGKEMALSMITMNNVDVIFGMASGSDIGMREAVQESENCWSVAQPSDAIMDQAPETLLGCIVIDNAALLGMAMEKVMAGTFGDEIIQGGLAEGVVYVGRMGVSAADIQDEFLEHVEQLKAGEIEVKYNF